MSSTPHQARRLLLDPRALGFLLIVVGALVFANVSQVHDGAELAFRWSAEFDDRAQLEEALAARNGTARAYAAVEYGGILLAVAGVTLLVGGTVARRRRAHAEPAVERPAGDRSEAQASGRLAPTSRGPQ